MPQLNTGVYTYRPDLACGVQIVKFKAANDGTNTFDLRESEPDILTYPVTKIQQDISWTFLSTIAAVLGALQTIFSPHVNHKCKIMPSTSFSQKLLITLSTA